MNELAVAAEQPIFDIGKVPRAGPEGPLLGEIRIGIGESKKMYEAFASTPIDFADPKLATRTATAIMKSSLQAANRIALEAFGRGDTSERAIIIRGNRVDVDLVPTPSSGQLNPSATPISSGLQLGYMGLIGTQVVAYEGENGNELFRQVVGRYGADDQKSSQGAIQIFGWHADNPTLAMMSEPSGGKGGMPEFLELFNLRCEVSVATKIAFVESILESCRRRYVECLHEPETKVYEPDSFEIGERRFVPNLPVLSTRNGRTYCRYDTENCEGQTELARLSLDHFNKAATDHCLEIYLNPGDMLIFRNQEVVHMRDGFEPRFDGTDRWLQRLFGVSMPEYLAPKDPNVPHVLKTT